MSLSAATVAKKRKDKQLDAISQEHQSTWECDDRLGTQTAEMGPEGLQDTSAWTFADSKTYLGEEGRRKAENAKALRRHIDAKYSART